MLHWCLKVLFYCFLVTERCQVHCSTEAAFCIVQNQERVFSLERNIFSSMPQQRSHSLCCSVNPGWFLREYSRMRSSSGVFHTWETVCCDESCSIILQVIKSTYDLRLRNGDSKPQFFSSFMNYHSVIFFLGV